MIRLSLIPRGNAGRKLELAVSIYIFFFIADNKSNLKLVGFCFMMV